MITRLVDRVLSVEMHAWVIMGESGRFWWDMGASIQDDGFSEKNGESATSVRSQQPGPSVSVRCRALGAEAENGCGLESGNSAHGACEHGKRMNAAWTQTARPPGLLRRDLLRETHGLAMQELSLIHSLARQPGCDCSRASCTCDSWTESFCVHVPGGICVSCAAWTAGAPGCTGV